MGKADRVKKKVTNMLETIRKAGMDDLPALLRFYEDVCAAQAKSEYSPQWHFGIYPAEEDMALHIASGSMYLGLAGARIAAAGVLTAGEDPMYADAAWREEAAPDEAACLHLFAVHEDFRGRGVSGAMLDGLLAAAGDLGKRLVRLDVVKGNLPAEKLYLRHGFRFAEEREVFYEDTGAIRVRLYERLL